MTINHNIMRIIIDKSSRYKWQSMINMVNKEYHKIFRSSDTSLLLSNMSEFTLCCDCAEKRCITGYYGGYGLCARNIETFNRRHIKFPLKKFTFHKCHACENMYVSIKLLKINHPEIKNETYNMSLAFMNYK